MPKAVEALSVSQIEALAKAEGERWNRQGRLAAWMMNMLPGYVALGVGLGVAACFGKDADLPRLPEWEDLLKTLPDYMREPDGEG